ncbi:hypothetical protein BCR33DRAFT_743338 [Rhizoclosmatium globosum]|uniref:DUF4097 domain-containing protein n=1 Tax=Rhizoclosmatium globosum TaxID=329046 RepID=A0A1Y2BIB6_9FUNG|nr:hypothetical protein BCR33DRAFT_743338 [Rhizoclosmatium globosum]|eukprot:ORY34528.1 hypothetical protein BCR33DRAFT_743338 [Rhizoclosmatium globosum]
MSTTTTTILPTKFEGLVIVSTGKGQTDTIVRTAASSFFSAGQTTVSLTDPTSKATLSYETTSDNKLQVNVAYNDDALAFSWASATSFFGFNTPPKTALEVTIPQSITDFAIKGSVGSLNYQGPDLKKNFTADYNVGSVKAASITAENVSINTNVGAVDLGQVTARNTVTVITNVGAVRADAIKGFKDLIMRADVGSIQADLYPAVHDANIDLQTGTGNVLVSVFGFKGKFQASSGLGPLRVSGPAIVGGHNVSIYTGTAKGWVAKQDSFGSFKGYAGLGLMNVAFN